MRKISLADQVPQSADAVWAVIGDFSGIRKWARAVEAESTEVTPEGKVRALTMPGGRVISELMIDEGPHHYTYTLKRPDLTTYESTVSVVPNAVGCMIALSVLFEPAEGVDLTEATENLLKFLGGNLKAMKRAAAG
jgi:hypothetical protein